MMIVLDTCALLFDALTPERLSATARRLLDEGEKAGTLVCADISLWEVATLVDKGRLSIPAPLEPFLEHLLALRGTRALPVTPAIAARSVALGLHGDPADRLIAATAAVHGATLLSADEKLRQSPGVRAVW